MHAVLLCSQIAAALRVRFYLRVHPSLRVRVGTGSFSQTLSTFAGAVAGHGPRVHARQLGNHNCQVITSAWQTHRVALSLSLSRARALSLAPAPALAHVLLCLRLGAERRCYTVMRGAELKVMLSLALALALAPSRARSLSRAWQDFSRTSALSLMSMRHA